MGRPRAPRNAQRNATDTHENNNSFVDLRAAPSIAKELAVRLRFTSVCSAATAVLLARLEAE